MGLYCVRRRSSGTGSGDGGPITSTVARVQVRLCVRVPVYSAGDQLPRRAVNQPSLFVGPLTGQRKVSTNRKPASHRDPCPRDLGYWRPAVSDWTAPLELFAPATHLQGRRAHASHENPRSRTRCAALCSLRKLRPESPPSTQSTPPPSTWNHDDHPPATRFTCGSARFMNSRLVPTRHSTVPSADPT